MKRTYGITRAASGIAVLPPLIGSPRAARRLNKLGFKAAALEGGFNAWKERHEVEPAEAERAEAR